MAELLPEEHIDKIVRAFGQSGKDWLDNLPSVLSVCQNRWEIDSLTTFAEEAWNYVGFSEAQSVVVKCFYDEEEFNRQEKLLRHVGDRDGWVQLIDSFPEQKALLLSQVMPGSPLSETLKRNPDEAFRVAEGMLQSCKMIPLPDCLRDESELVAEFEEGRGCLDNALIDSAKQILEELLCTSRSEKVFAHGDLHPGNVLRSGTSWVAIDPEGFAASPYFDSAYLFRAAAEFLDVNELIKLHLHPFCCGLELEPGTLLRWAYSLEVLSRCWACGDNLSEAERRTGTAYALREAAGI